MDKNIYAIELENITKTFGSVVANKNINLNVCLLYTSPSPRDS